MAKTQYGVMQGRLSPPENGRFQAFPRNSWREEFARAREAGFSYIEWIHDEYGRTANPIFSEEGRAEIAELKSAYGIETPALCGDWLMDFPLIRCTGEERASREAHLRALIGLAAKIGAKRMVLPFVDDSRIATTYEQAEVAEVLWRLVPFAKEHSVELHLEADFPPAEFARFLELVDDPFVKVNWDSGNSSGLGYRAHEEFAAYGSRLGSVHIKDRFRKTEGGVETRPLGQGSADFDDVFQSLRTLGYSGGLTLQVARGKDGEEVEFLRRQLAFVKDRWD